MVNVKKDPDDVASNDTINNGSQEIGRKPGQKFPTPTPGNGDCVFYKTLLRQRPESIMAQEWCVNHGVLPEEEAERYYKQMLKRKQQKGGSTAVSSTGSSNGTKKSRKSSSSKKAVFEEKGFDSGINMGGDEGIGAMAL